MSDKGTLQCYDKMKKKRGGVMAKKKGINTLQRLMNVVFIIWVLWCLFSMFIFLTSSGLELSRMGINSYTAFSLFLGWLPILAVNYIFNKKATVWNKGS